MKLYNTGLEKINKAYSIDKIIRDIRNTKNIVKNYLSKSITTRTLFDIQHSKKFVIDIDSDDGRMTADKAILKIQQAYKRRSIKILSNNDTYFRLKENLINIKGERTYNKVSDDLLNIINENR